MYTIIYYMLILSSMFVDETANDQSLAIVFNQIAIFILISVLDVIRIEIIISEPGASETIQFYVLDAIKFAKNFVTDQFFRI